MTTACLTTTLFILLTLCSPHPASDPVTILTVCDLSDLLTQTASMSSKFTQRGNLIQINTRYNDIMKTAVFNAHSIQGTEMKEKRTGIREFIKDEEIDFMFVTETWLKGTNADKSKLSEVTPPGYKPESLPRGSLGGGVLAIYRDHIPVTITKSFPFPHKSFELLQLSVTSPQHIHFFCLYRTPPRKKNRLKPSDFKEELPELLDYANVLRGKSIILGDFNVHFNDQHHPETKSIMDITTSFDLTQGVNEPTFYRSGNIVDWVLYREADNLVSSCAVSHLLSSDHPAVVCHLNVARPKRQPVYRTVRDLKGINRTSFKSDVSALVSDLGSDITAQNLHDGLRQLLDRHAPATEKKVPLRKDPWYPAIADKLRPAKQERRRAERRYRKSKLSVHLDIMRNHNQEVTNIVQKAKENYYSSKVKDSRDSKTFYKNCDELLGNSKDSTLPTNIPDPDLPDAFSIFFQSKIKTIRDDLDNLNDDRNPLFADSPHSTSSFSAFHPVSENEVRKVIVQSCPKTCALDPIPTSLLVECVDVLLPAITSIINHSLQTGTFPDIFKQAIVTPLIKKPSLDSNTLKNYRPVSNLSFLSKITEKLALSQLTDYLHSNNLFPSTQSAYRPAHSTETALLRITNDLLQALDSGKISLLTLLDLSAAFDTIDHQILLKRLSHSFGITDSALSWISSYLSNRTQTVITNKHSSQPFVLEFGVPQGSVLGPVLFLLYTKPISSVTHNHSIPSQSFADDTQLHDSCALDTLQESIHNMQDCITDIKTWMTTNKLKLNDDKTEVLLIHSHKKIPPDSTPKYITVGQSEIQFSEQARNLGVTITDTLSMDKHITNTCRSAYNELRKIASIRHLLTFEATKSLTCSLVLSKLDYCNSLLSNIPKTHIERLQKIQNSAARLVFRAKKTEHAKPLLQKLHWLPIHARIQYKISTLCFKSLTEPHFPAYLSDLLHPSKPLRTLRTSNDSRKFTVPRSRRITFGDRSFSVSAPSLWNSLPTHVRHSTTLSCFKTSLKTYLFRTFYDLESTLV